MDNPFFAIGGAVLVAGTAGLFVHWWQTPLKPADLAAWVQAVGSLLAVCAAIFISTAQSRREHKAKAARDAVMREYAEAAAYMAIAAIIHVPQALSDPENLPALLEFGFPESSFDKPMLMIERFPFTELPDAHAWVRLQILATLVDGQKTRAALSLGVIRDHGRLTGEIVADLQERADHATTLGERLWAGPPTEEDDG